MGAAGASAMLDAAKKNDLNKMKSLLKKKADLEAKDDDGNTPLALASLRGHKETVECLIDAKANLENKSNYGNTPLARASRKGWKGIVKCLIDAKVNLENKDNDGNTPLALASLRGHKETVECLIDAKANLENKSNYGNTPLARASRKGWKGIVKCLIDAKANLENKNNNGDTPLNWASYNGHKETVKCLIDAKAKNDRISLRQASGNGVENNEQILVSGTSEMPQHKEAGNQNCEELLQRLSSLGKQQEGQREGSLVATHICHRGRYPTDKSHLERHALLFRRMKQEDSDAFVIYLECDQESDKPSQVSRKSKDEFWRDLSGERVETIPHVFQLPAEQVYERAVSKLGKKKGIFLERRVAVGQDHYSVSSEAFVNWCIEGEQVLNEDLGLLSSLLDCADVVHHRKDRSKCKVDSYILAEHGTNRTKKIYWTIHKKNSHAVLAFSGSQNIENWIQNLKFALRSPGELISKDVKVHHGFLEYIEELGKALSELYRQCETELASERAFIVYLVGHSLGGALASLAAACLVLNQKFSKITSKVMRVVTFGQPSVGDSAFAKLYNEIGLGSRTTRVMMSKDAVPDLPHTYVSWYRHVGTGIYADALLPRKAQRKSTWWSPLSWRVWKFSHLPAPHLLPAYRMAIDQKTHLEKICEAQSPTGKLSREKKKTSTNGDPSREPIFAKIVDASKNDSEAVLYNSRHMRQLGEMLRHIPKASHQMPENIAKIFKSDTKEVALSFCPPSPARGAATEMSGLVTLGSGLYYEKIKSDLRRELHSQTDEIKNEVRDCKQHMDDGFTHIKGTLAQMKETMELQTVQLSHIISGQEMTHRQLEKINSKLDEIPRLIQKSDKMKLAREYREHWNKVQHSYNRASQRGSDAHKSLKSVSKNMIFHIKSVLQTYCPNPGHQMRLPYVAGFVFASRARMDAFLFEAAPTHSYEASQGATKYDNYQRWDKTKVAEWLNKHDSPDVQDCSDQFLQEGINGSVLKELNIDEDYDNFFAEMKFGGVGRKRLLKKYIKSLENSPGKEVKEDHDALEFIREAANLIDEELSHIAQCSRFNLAEIVERHFSTMTQLMSLRHGLFSGLRNNSRTAALSSKEGKVSDYANQWRIVEQVRDIVLRLGKIPRECVRALVEAVAPGAHASFFASLNVEFEGEMASVKPAARAIDMKLVSKMVDTPANRKALREYLQEHPYAITHFDLESLEEVVVSCLSPGMDEELLLSLMHEDHKRSWESKRIASKITSMTTKHPLICLTAHHRRVDVVGMIHQEENGLEALRALMHMNVFSSTETDNKMIQKIVEDIAPKLNIPKVHREFLCKTNGASIEMRLQLAMEYLELLAKVSPASQ